MLPFKKEGSISMPVSMNREPDHEFDGLEYAAEDLMRAIHTRDIKAVTAALRAVFQLMESQPHEEGPHV